MTNDLLPPGGGKRKDDGVGRVSGKNKIPKIKISGAPLSQFVFLFVCFQCFQRPRTFR